MHNKVFLFHVKIALLRQGGGRTSMEVKNVLYKLGPHTFYMYVCLRDMRVLTKLS